MLIIGRSLVLVAVLSALVSSAALYGARHLHNEFEGFLEARLQSDLIANNSEYRRALIDIEGARLIFVGDIMLSRGPEIAMTSRGDFKYPFLATADVLREADITFGNLEGPISTRGIDSGSVYSFRARPAVVEGLEFAGFDVMSIANNHIFDWGSDAVEDTISVLESSGISTVGAGSNYKEANDPSISRVGGIKVGFLAYTDLYPESLVAEGDVAGVSNLDDAEDSVRALSESVDIVIVSVHWGEEYKAVSNVFQRELARKLVDSGADLIIGHHPHVVQEVEEYNGGWIVYSLGNFVFDQSFSDETRTGMVIDATVKGKRLVGIDKRFVRISKTFQPEFVNL